MEEGKKGIWFKVVLSVWMLLTMAVNHIAKEEEPFVGDPERWQILNYIMMSIAVIGGVVSLVCSIKNTLKK